MDPVASADPVGATDPATAPPPPAGAEPPRPEPTPSPPRGHRKLWLLVGAAVIVVAIAAVLAITLLSGSSSSITAHGTMDVVDFFGGCQTAFSDISDGTQVVVTDSSGQVIATGNLSYNASVSNTLSPPSPVSGTQCVYNFTVTVPNGLPRYGITISHRGTIYFSAAQMSQGPGLSLCTGASGACNTGNTGNTGLGNTGTTGNTD